MDENVTNCAETEPYESEMPDKDEYEVQERENQGTNRKPRKCAIWKFFKKIPPMSEKRAKCAICHGVKSYKSSSTNLQMHLKLKHNTEFHQYMQIKNNNMEQRAKNLADVNTTETDCDNSVRQDEPRCRDPTIWKYFENLSPVEKMAKCNFCQQVRSYRTSITNLKTHLSLRHPEVVENDQKLVRGMSSGYQKKGRRPRESSGSKTKMWEFLEMETDDDGAHNGTTDTGNLKFSSEIWRHFDVEDDETICGLCRESIPPGLEEMKNHLEEKHSNVLDDVAQKVLDAASEEDNVLEDENMYTEIIYLEDETDKNIKQEKRQKRTRQQRAKVKSERKASTSSDEVLLKPKHRKYLCETNKEPDELEPFINYITVLLKKVPKESSQKLHLDIINLIMNATQHQNNIITANINFNPANTNVSTIETVNFNNSNAVLDKSIVLTQTNTSDVNCMNTQRIAMPVQHFVTINDEKNTVPHVVTVSNTRMNNIN